MFRLLKNAIQRTVSTAAHAAPHTNALHMPALGVQFHTLHHRFEQSVHGARTYSTTSSSRHTSPPTSHITNDFAYVIRDNVAYTLLKSEKGVIFWKQPYDLFSSLPPKNSTHLLPEQSLKDIYRSFKEAKSATDADKIFDNYKNCSDAAAHISAAQRDRAKTSPILSGTGAIPGIAPSQIPTQISTLPNKQPLHPTR